MAVPIAIGSVALFCQIDMLFECLPVGRQGLQTLIYTTLPAKIYAKCWALLLLGFGLKLGSWYLFFPFVSPPCDW